MRQVGSRPFDGVRKIVPALTVALAILVDVMPLPSPAPTAIAPLLVLCVIFHWTIHRADLFGIVSTFVACFLLDVLAGLPPGLTALAFILGRTILAPGRRFLVAAPFVVEWVCFILAVVLILSLRWLIATLWWSHLFALEPVLVEMLLTIAAYPLVSWFLTRLKPFLPAVGYASGS